MKKTYHFVFAGRFCTAGGKRCRELWRQNPNRSRL